jgi:hypothetical protein
LHLPRKERPRVAAALREFAGYCECCGRSKPGGNNQWNIDHKGSKFRGILCWYCNIVLGLVYDNTATLKAMIKYLRKTRQGRKDKP